MSNSLSSNLPDIKKALDTGKIVEFETHGFSMIPLLHDGGDKVLLRKAKFLKLNDVALCKTDEGRYVLHRVINLNNSGYTLKGDNCVTTEHCTGNDDVIGVAVGFIRKGRKISVNSWSYQFYVRHRTLFLKLWRVFWHVVNFFVKLFRR